APSQQFKHHHARENDRSGIDDIEVSVFRGSAMGGFKDGVSIADVSTRSDAEPANLRRASVRDVIAVQVGSGQHAVLLRPNDHLLKDGIGNAIVDHQFLLPLPVDVSAVKTIEDVLHLGMYTLSEFFKCELQAGFDLLRILLNRDLRVFIFVVENPALAFGDDAIAK